jgi:hypothetical protein
MQASTVAILASGFIPVGCFADCFSGVPRAARRKKLSWPIPVV